MGDVIYKDLGLNRIVAQLSAMDGAGIQTGIVGSKAEQLEASGLTVGEVGLMNEYGTKDIPERSFIRSTLQDKMGLFKGILLRETLNLYSNRGTPDQILNNVGKAMTDEIKKKVESGPPPANAPSTTRKKGFDHPLLETSSLHDAIGYEIVRANGEVVGSAGSAEDYESFEIEGL